MNPNTHHGCNCNHETNLCPPCPPLEPIVCPTRVRVINRCFPIDQPILVPTHTRIVNHFIPRPRYIPSFTTSEENICPGQNTPRME